MDKNKLLKDLEILKNQKAEESDFMIQMELADSIHKIEMKLNNIKPESSEFECEGCGS